MRTCLAALALAIAGCGFDGIDDAPVCDPGRVRIHGTVAGSRVEVNVVARDAMLSGNCRPSESCFQISFGFHGHVGAEWAGTEADGADASILRGFIELTEGSFYRSGDASHISVARDDQDRLVATFYMTALNDTDETAVDGAVLGCLGPIE